MPVGESDGADRRLDLAPPMVEEVVQRRVARGHVILLEGELLQQAWVVGHEVVHLDQAEAIAFELKLEVPSDETLGHSSSPAEHA